MDDSDFIELDIRPAYHDLTDIPDGYPEGSQLRFLATRLRYWTEDSKLDVEELTLIDINSLSPRDAFFSPTSWKIGVGAVRSELSSDRSLAAYLKGGAGFATRALDGLLFIYLQGSLQAHRDIHKGYGLGPGLQLGWARQRSESQTLIQLDYEHYIEGTEIETYEFSIQQGFALSDSSQWMTSFMRRKIGGSEFFDWSPEWVSEWRLEYRHYF